jgi:hypothetical protein
MYRTLTLLLFLGLTTIAPAQQFAEISYGPGYTRQVYYQLDGDAAISIEHAAWDLAFTAMGFQDAGIHLNEAAGSQGTALELYLAPSNDFDAAINPDQLGERLFNDEKSWSYGAFNANRAPGDPFDFGWGRYNPTTNQITGNQVYVLKLRDGSYKKLEIVSLIGTVYTFRHADLDGNAEVQLTLNKSDFPNSELAFFSLSTGGSADAMPNTTDWDLVFTRYSTTLEDGMGSTLNYLVTGTLSGLGVEVARADAIDPTNVDHNEYADAYVTDLDAIGYDWKDFDLNTFSWNLPPDRVYFVKTAAGRIWKLFFIDFEGASTGTVVFEKTDLGLVSSTTEAAGTSLDLNLFPNPAAEEEVTATFSLERAEPGRLSLHNAVGQEVWSSALIPFPAGFQARRLPIVGLSPGIYFLRLELQSGQSARPLIINR